jgi:hypothetical protein
MSLSVDPLAAVPVSIAVTVVALRYGPAALLTLIAGIVAVLTPHHRRGERALAVLHLLQGASRSRSDDPSCRRNGSARRTRRA